MIRRIATGDIDGDGRDEIVLGCGNMRCVAVSPEGKQLWEFRTDHGTCTTLDVVDVDSDGRCEVIGGKGIFSSNSHGFQLNDKGERVVYYRNQGWTSIVCDQRVTDLDGDGRYEAIFGTDRGENLRVFDAKSGNLRWAKALGDNCEAIATVDLDGDARQEVIAGSASLYVSAFTAEGKRLWFTAAPDSVTALAAGDLDGDSRPELTIGSADGTLTVLDRNGEPLTSSRAGAPVRKLAFVHRPGSSKTAVLVGRSDGSLKAVGLKR